MTFSGRRAMLERKGLLLCLLLPLVLAACKVDLYSNLNEPEANEMMALLLRNGVECEKQPGQEQFWVIRVDDSVTSKALEILRSSGYPKQPFVSMGDIFKKEGLVSSPLEERIRFIYALSQELSHTISQIDGVITARVHIVLPDNNPLSEHTLPAAASVFIKHRPDSNVGAHIPQIKGLVTNSIEGLSYAKVTVVLFESLDAFPHPTEVSYKKLLGLTVAQDSVRGFFILIGCMALLVCLAAGGAAFFYWKALKKANTPRAQSPQGERLSEG